MPLNYKGKGGSLKTCDYYITSLGFASCEDFSATLPVSREVNPATLRHVRNPFFPSIIILYTIVQICQPRYQIYSSFDASAHLAISIRKSTIALLSSDNVALSSLSDSFTSDSSSSMLSRRA